MLHSRLKILVVKFRFVSSIQLKNMFKYISYRIHPSLLTSYPWHRYQHPLQQQQIPTRQLKGIRSKNATNNTTIHAFNWHVPTPKSKRPNVIPAHCLHSRNGTSTTFPLSSDAIHPWRPDPRLAHGCPARGKPIPFTMLVAVVTIFCQVVNSCPPQDMIPMRLRINTWCKMCFDLGPYIFQF